VETDFFLNCLPYEAKLFNPYVSHT